jgi:hypothetical membrane protein
MSDTIPGITLGGRKVRPVAFGVTVLMVGLVAIGVFNLGDYPHRPFQLAGSVFPAAAAILLITGWVKNNGKLTGYGLALALFTYLGRVIFLAIEDPVSDNLLLAFGVTIILAGSYVLEVNNRGGR